MFTSTPLSARSKSRTNKACCTAGERVWRGGIAGISVFPELGNDLA